MKNFIALIFAGFLANTTYAASIANVEVGACTRDFNPWGHSGSCECPSDTRYEKALGQCVQGLALNIAVDGVISAEPNFTGDTVDLVLSNANEGNYKLVMTRAMRAEFEELVAQELNYRIKGEVLNSLDEGDLTARPTLIVKSIEVLATFREALPVEVALPVEDTLPVETVSCSN